MPMVIAMVFAIVVGTALTWIMRALRADDHPLAGVIAVISLLVIIFVVRTPITVGRYLGVDGSLHQRLGAGLIGILGTVAIYAFLDRAQIRNWILRERQ